MENLIDSDRLFTQLLKGINIPGATVAVDLDVDSFDDVPFITHRSTISQSGNGPGIWTAVLTVNVFIEASTATFETVRALYRGIHAWDAPTAGVVPTVGAVENVDRDLEAFTRVGQSVDMLSKSVTQYVGAFELTLRSAPTQ